MTKMPEYLLAFIIFGSEVHEMCYLFALAVSIVIMPQCDNLYEIKKWQT